MAFAEGCYQLTALACEALIVARVNNDLRSLATLLSARLHAQCTVAIASE